MRRCCTLVAAVAVVLGSWMCASARAADPPIPHGQDVPPGPPLSPEEAMARMTVPEGFTVELVAAEPDLVNPVAMTFDERGRAWICESLEYPRREAGPGRDRVKVLEDTDGDGRADRFDVFAEGLNIPSGIAVGYGGVWVANSPDILFLEDTDGDGRADRQEVVVTGFGRADTHELPNSLTWGPDGWLYGLNGVFNPSRIEHRGQTYEFTCALWRIHPRTRDFEVFCEGTSNPWGVAFDDEGSAFVSACVIDHLWHLVETGYYHRQGGPYPPHTWKIGSIVEHKHQKAAYCGLHWYDSDAYPEAFRRRLYMGNIHGACLNVDTLERDGSTYFARPADDFLSAHDAWFMPVVQKTGPDGSLYVLDWYDRYHCYQDANRDPEGIDRGRGRLYRVRYGDTPRRFGFDLAAASDDELIGLLDSGNGYDRDIAQRLLAERAGEETQRKLETLVLDRAAPRRQRMHALWARLGSGAAGDRLLNLLLQDPDPLLRAWGVRAAGNQRDIGGAVQDLYWEAAWDRAPEVRLQVAIAAKKLNRQRRTHVIETLATVLAHAGDDAVAPRIVWRNLEPLLTTEEDVVFCFEQLDEWGDKIEHQPWFAEFAAQLDDRLLSDGNLGARITTRLFDRLAEGSDESRLERLLASIASKIQSGEIAGERLDELRSALAPRLASTLAGTSRTPLYTRAALLAASWGDAAAIAAVADVARDRHAAVSDRLAAFEALAAANDPSLADVTAIVLSAGDENPELRGGVLAVLGRLEDPAVAEAVLAAWTSLPPDVQPRAIELLIQRDVWARKLLAAIGAQQVPAAALSSNQVRRLLASDDEELVAEVRRHWGTLRADRNPEREQVVADMRRLVRGSQGDPQAGWRAYDKVCGQCHKLWGRGQEVGPDITLNGRSSFAQLLSNVFDPSLVVGAAYQARTLQTADGRVLSGLPVEESDQRVVLKLQGGKLETVPREEIEEYELTPLSLMPEGVERQLSPQELVDLFALIALDRPADDPQARHLAGYREVTPGETTDPAGFAELAAEVAPGFAIAASGEGGLALLAEHRGRSPALRTHPVDPEQPCVLRKAVSLPAGKRSWLLLSASHDERGDWRLIARAGGQVLFDGAIGPDTTDDGWTDLRIDLSPLAGQEVELELENRATGWSYEFGYWGDVRVVSE
jgi:putative membrane-bound dehydrogenase-like protein